MTRALLLLFLGLHLWLVPAHAQSSRVIETATMDSRILGREIGYAVYLPPQFERDKRRYPVIVLLHGAGDGAPVDWFRFMALDRRLDRLIAEGRLPPLVAIAPDGRRPDDPRNTYFLNDARGPERWEDMLLTEFLPRMSRRYRLIGAAEARGLLGISMGGFAAVLHHLRHPDTFGGAAALSGAFRTEREIVEMPQDAFDQRFGGAFGAGRAGEARLTDAFRAADPATILPDVAPGDIRLHLDVGADDPFFEGNAALHLALRAQGIAHGFIVRPGGHDWAYWDSGLDAALLHLGAGFQRRD